MMRTCIFPGTTSSASLPAAASLPLVFIPNRRLLFPSSQQATHLLDISRNFKTSSTSLQEPTLNRDDENEGFVSSISATAAPPGHIELVIGPMFAGKSSELLQKVATYESYGLTVAIVKSNKDNRYSSNHVVTHDGNKKECHAVPSLTAFREEFTAVYQAADVIAVDEAQFFPDLKEFCTFAADQDSKRVILAGLDGDFMRQRFGQVLDLVPLADKVTKLTAVCKYCQEEAEKKGEDAGDMHFPAVFSLRIAAESGQEVVGGADKYAPVCRRHYVQLSKTSPEHSSNGNGSS